MAPAEGLPPPRLPVLVYHGACDSSPMVAMSEEISIERAGFVERAIVRHRAGQFTDAIDHVAEEIPVALVFNGISHVVMMATPRDLEAFAYGFALTEGVVASAGAIFDCEVFLRPDSAEVSLSIAQEDFVRLKDRRRQLTGRTGCGVCGIYAALSGAASVTLTDHNPAVLATLQASLGLNPLPRDSASVAFLDWVQERAGFALASKPGSGAAAAAEALAAAAGAGALDASGTPFPLVPQGRRFDVVLAADVLCGPAKLPHHTP